MKIGHSSLSKTSPCQRYGNVRRPKDVPLLSFPLVTTFGRRGCLIFFTFIGNNYDVTSVRRHFTFTSAIQSANLTFCCIQCDAEWIVVYPVGSFTVPCPGVGVGPRGVRGSDITTSIVFNQEQAALRTPKPCHNTDGLQMCIAPCNMIHTGIQLYTCLDFVQYLWPDFWKRWCELS